MLPAVKSEARMPPTKPLIWFTEAANTAGPKSRPILRTPGSRQSTVGRCNNPKRLSDGNWNRSCATPAASTPQAKAIAGVSKAGVAAMAAMMSEAFNNTGVKAGTA